MLHTHKYHTHTHMESGDGGWELHGVVKLHGAGKGDGVPSLYGH